MAIDLIGPESISSMTIDLWGSPSSRSSGVNAPLPFTTIHASHLYRHKRPAEFGHWRVILPAVEQ
jgi:hypothetical protein